MKSFPLSELEFVKCKDNPIAWHESQQEKSAPKAAIVTKDDMEKLYNIDENNKESMWKYNFTLSFAGRQFVLACRTLKELENWVRVFELLTTMKEQKVDYEKTNPFEFEQSHGKIVNMVVENYKQELAEQ